MQAVDQIAKTTEIAKITGQVNSEVRPFLDGIVINSPDAHCYVIAAEHILPAFLIAAERMGRDGVSPTTMIPALYRALATSMTAVASKMVPHDHPDANAMLGNLHGVFVGGFTEDWRKTLMEAYDLTPTGPAANDDGTPPPQA